MPQPILFAACEKVILDIDGLVSLINIIERLEVSVPASVQLPSGPVGIPQRWQAISIWRLDESDGLEYEQMTDVIVPDGSVVMHTEPEKLVANVPGRKGSKVISTLKVVPIAAGPLRLRLFYRPIGEAAWTQAATYPVDVDLVRT